VRALVVGRFQPLHNGHVQLIRRALEECVNVTVAIGSSTARPSLRNPFTLDERRRMLEAVFANQVQIVALPDIHDPARWAAHVLSITGPVDRLYGNDADNTGLFEAAGMMVESPGLVERERFEASRIRAQLAEDDPAWRKAVPAAVARLLDEWRAPQRLMSMEGLA
jgi:nicotinamide-nucleotide adenylyltransferase